MKRLKSNAFTLAEVLITLGIIGVVAALTIPALLTNLNHIKLQSQFKEGYSILARMVKEYNADDERGNLVNDQSLYKNFIKYFDNNNYYDKIKAVKLPFFTYDKYEELLALCDINLVRGEDSFVRALLLAKPFLWHIYPQDENAHIIKLESFLEKYCPNNKELKETFINYNINKDDFSYFFKNLDEIKKYNEKYSDYLIENCNLIDKLINFIEKI